MPAFDFVGLRQQLQERYALEPSALSDEDAMSAALYPKVFDEYMEFILEYGKLSAMPTRQFFVGPEIGEDTTVEIEKVCGPSRATERGAYPDG